MFMCGEVQWLSMEFPGAVAFAACEPYEPTLHEAITTVGEIEACPADKAHAHMTSEACTRYLSAGG